MPKIITVMKTHEIPAGPPALVVPTPSARLRIGVDIAQISAIDASIADFGERFLNRIFSPGEIAYATAVPAQTAQRLAARFAAKEAAMKAFGLGEAGIGWRDIEVTRTVDGAVALALHARAAALVEQSGCTDIALTLSHDGDYAAAFVAALAPAEPCIL